MNNSIIKIKKMEECIMPEVRMYLGAPQTAKLQVRTVSGGSREIIKQMVLTNTDQSAPSKLTVTINTVDVMKDITLAAGETKVIDMYQVLEPGDTVFLQQEKENAINVLMSGVTGIM